MIVHVGNAAVATTAAPFFSRYLPLVAPVCGPSERMLGSDGFPLPVGNAGAVDSTVGLKPNVSCVALLGLPAVRQTASVVGSDGNTNSECEPAGTTTWPPVRCGRM